MKPMRAIDTIGSYYVDLKAVKEINKDCVMEGAYSHTCLIPFSLANMRATIQNQIPFLISSSPSYFIIMKF